MEMRCHVCTSPYRAEYERLYIDKKKTLTELVEIARLRGEKISKDSFSRHFRRHFIPLVDAQSESDKFIEEVVQKRIQEKLSTLDEVDKIITICKDKVERLIEEEPNPDNVRALNMLLTQIRKNLEFLYKITKELKVEPTRTREEVVNDIIYLCQDFPVEYLEKIENRIKELENR